MKEKGNTILTSIPSESMREYLLYKEFAREPVGQV